MPGKLISVWQSAIKVIKAGGVCHASNTLILVCINICHAHKYLFFHFWYPSLSFVPTIPRPFALHLSFKSEKTRIREERSRNAAFRNKNKYTVCPCWYQCFQTGWESRKQGVEDLPRFYKPGGLLGFIIIWGPIFSQVYLEWEGEWRWQKWKGNLDLATHRSTGKIERLLSERERKPVRDRKEQRS